LEDLGLDGRIILKMDLQEVRWGMDWIGLAQSSGTSRELVNVKINFRLHKLRGNSGLAAYSLASLEGLYSMELAGISCLK
jgi:hypothetical protein